MFSILNAQYEMAPLTVEHLLNKQRQIESLMFSTFHVSSFVLPTDTFVELSAKIMHSAV